MLHNHLRNFTSHKLAIDFYASDKTDHRTDGVNQFRPRLKIRGDHLRGFGDARLPVSLRHCAHGSQYAGRRKKDSFLFHLSLKF